MRIKAVCRDFSVFIVSAQLLRDEVSNLHGR